MPLVRYRMFGGENIPARAMVENMVEWNATLNNSIFETFYFDQSVSIFLISNVRRIEYTRGPRPPGAVRFIDQR